jgi:hypothetical protein
MYGWPGIDVKLTWQSERIGIENKWFALTGRVNHRIIKAGWSWGCVSAVDSNGRTIWIADAHRDGKRFIVRADEKLTAFLELQRVTRESFRFPNAE